MRNLKEHSKDVEKAISELHETKKQTGKAITETQVVDKCTKYSLRVNHVQAILGL